MQRVKLPTKLLRHNAVQALLELVSLRDVRVYLVGGSVRDLMCGKSITDIDMVVTGIPYKKLGTLLAKRGTVQTVGDFGTMKFIAEGEHLPVDIALPRTEQSTAVGTRTGFAVRFDETLPIEDDLGRRDFTVNAMAIDLVTKNLIDPFHGTNDLAERVIRAVGNPTKRFTEDYTRVLRAFRFACELGADIAVPTRKALKVAALKLAEGLVPGEMIAAELTKALIADPVRCIELLGSTGIGRILLPEVLALRDVRESRGASNTLVHTERALAASRSERYKKHFGVLEKDPTVLFALLFHDLGKAKTREQRRTGGRLVSTFNRHAERSADLTQIVWERLKLSQSGANRTGMLNAITHHMVLERAHLPQIRNQTLDQYFLMRPAEGLVLKKVIWCDWEAGDSNGRRAHDATFHHLEERLRSISSRTYRKGKPIALLSGTDIMKEFRIPAGEELGALLATLRSLHVEGSLATPDDAREYVRTHTTHGSAHNS